MYHMQSLQPFLGRGVCAGGGPGAPNSAVLGPERASPLRT